MTYKLNYTFVQDGARPVEHYSTSLKAQTSFEAARLALDYLLKFNVQSEEKELWDGALRLPNGEEIPLVRKGSFIDERELEKRLQ